MRLRAYGHLGERLRCLTMIAMTLLLTACANAVSLPAETAIARLAPNQSTVLVTGANRGIGLAFAEYYANNGWNVIATARKPDQADELNALAAANPTVVVEQLDVTDLDRIKTLAAKYMQTPIDLLINNAAVLGDLQGQKIDSLDYPQFEWAMAVNVYGPMAMAEAFKPSIAMSEQKKIVTLTSGLGSLRLMGRMEGMTYYRLSKSAVNMGMRAIRATYKKEGITVALIAPGMVNTQLLADSGYRGKALTPADSVAGMADIIARLNIEDDGTPTNVDGKTIPW